MPAVSYNPPHYAKEVESMLAQNSMWKPIWEDKNVFEQLLSFRLELKLMPERERKVNGLHEPTETLDRLIMEYYPKIGLGGIMAVCVDVGGDSMMKAIGHYAGQRISQLIDISHGDFSQLRDALAVLSTHTSAWCDIHAIKVKAHSQMNTVLIGGVQFTGSCGGC